MGFVGNIMDHQMYLSWMRQAVDGNSLFEVKYTTEQQKPVFFQPLFFLLGRLAGIGNFDIVSVYKASRLVLGFLLLLLIYAVCGIFLSGEKRMLAFILCSAGTGFGWLVPGGLAEHLWRTFQIRSLDTDMVDGFAWLCIYTRPLFISAWILLIAAMVLFFLGLSGRKKWLVIASGLTGLVMILNHPYEAITMYSASGLLLLFFFIRDKKSDLHRLLLFGLFICFSVPAVIYEAWLFSSNSVFTEYAKVPCFSPNPYSYLFGYGFIALLAVPGIGIALKRRSDSDLFLLSWAAAVAFLSYAPFRFQSRVVLGFGFPLSILAVEGFYSKILPEVKLSRHRTVILLLVLLSLPSNYIFVKSDLKSVEKFPMNYNLFRDDTAAFEWMKNNLSHKSSVISSFPIGLYLPGRTGLKVYAGHYSQTAYFEKKLAALRKFYGDASESERTSLLRENNIDYVYMGRFEKMMGEWAPEKSGYLEPVYHNGETTVYRINVKMQK